MLVSPGASQANRLRVELVSYPEHFLLLDFNKFALWLLALVKTLNS